MRPVFLRALALYHRANGPNSLAWGGWRQQLVAEPLSGSPSLFSPTQLGHITHPRAGRRFRRLTLSRLEEFRHESVRTIITEASSPRPETIQMSSRQGSFYHIERKAVPRIWTVNACRVVITMDEEELRNCRCAWEP